MTIEAPAGDESAAWETEADAAGDAANAGDSTVDGGADMADGAADAAGQETEPGSREETDQLLSALGALKGDTRFRKKRQKKGADAIKKVVVGEVLNDPMVRNQVWVILLAMAFVIVYVAVRYQCQQDMIEIDKLETKLKDAKYRALSSSSELTEKTRETQIIKMLKHSPDSALHIPELPPYMIKVPENTNGE